MLSRYKELEVKTYNDTYYTEVYIGHDYNMKYLYFYRNDDMIKPTAVPLSIETAFDELASKFYDEYMQQKELGYE